MSNFISAVLAILFLLLPFVFHFILGGIFGMLLAALFDANVTTAFWICGGLNLLRKFIV